MNDEEDEAGKMKRNMLLLILKLGTQKTGNNAECVSLGAAWLLLHPKFSWQICCWLETPSSVGIPRW